MNGSFTILLRSLVEDSRYEVVRDALEGGPQLVRKLVYLVLFNKDAPPDLVDCGST